MKERKVGLVEGLEEQDAELRQFRKKDLSFIEGK